MASLERIGSRPDTTRCRPALQGNRRSMDPEPPLLVTLVTLPLQSPLVCHLELVTDEMNLRYMTARPCTGGSLRSIVCYWLTCRYRSDMAGPTCYTNREFGFVPARSEQYGREDVLCTNFPSMYVFKQLLFKTAQNDNNI